MAQMRQGQYEISTMARRQRAAAQAAAASLKQPVPLPDDGSDEEMVDAPKSDAPSPNEDLNEDGQDGEEGDEDPEDGDDTGTPARESDAASRSMTPVRPGRPSIPRKRRLGRPPKNRPPDWDTQDDTQEAASDAGTPKRTRGRGRGGSRWAKARGGPSHRTQVPIDKEGNMMDVIDDEVALPEDPEGETKVDKLGYLLGGREYRVRTFTVLDRGERLYMLSTEPARCIGFRDSYLFFQKHPLLYKIIIDEDAKRDLIDRDLIPHSYKGRAIGVVTARSVFREFGARIIIGGKHVIDDYSAQAARDRGEVDGEIAVPEDRLPPLGEPYNRNQYVAWHGASAVYHTGGPSVPMMNGKPAEAKKRKIAVTSDNWMLEHAREASRFNSTLGVLRRDNNAGIYDVHTNVIQYPNIMQPTHARWEVVSDEDEPTIEGYRLDDTFEPQPTEKLQSSTVFPKLTKFYPRNFMIHDIHLQSAPESNAAFDDDEAWDYERGNGLHAIPDEVLDELPPECRVALEEAREKQAEYRGQWTTERDDGMRAKFMSTTVWFP